MGNKHQHRDVNLTELTAVLARSKAAMNVDDYATLEAAMETLAFLQQELKSKGASIGRLRQIIFGAKTETTDKVIGNTNDKTSHGEESKKDAEKKKGHGRNGAVAYSGANKVKVPHPSLNAGQPCVGCLKGKVYPLAEPAMLIRITGMAPLSATVYECERFRCNLCGEVFKTPSPVGVGEEKYDETATAMVGLLKYGTGLPFNRIEKLQGGMGIPLPAATQWELVRDGVERLVPVHQEFIRNAAQGKILYNDDTTMKVLELTTEQRAAAAADNADAERTGVFTSGIVSTGEGQNKLALFFTGVKHAGENLADVLARRATELPKPIQMCDALSRNTTGDFETLLANCTAHARRKYVEVAEDFPIECKFVLETLRDVYKNDALARDMSPEERLSFHQTESKPLMDSLEKWMAEQFREHLVEPNSGLGNAIAYMQKHWVKLTLFLREPGAPLDNNLCERALKKAILHRKNSLFYKTLNGARVGDVYMSLIHSSELNGQNPFNYLVALLRHYKQVAAAPADWMPWNYQGTLSRMSAAAAAT